MAIAALLASTAAARADKLTIYTIPSPHGLSWKSPRSLFLSTARNQLSMKRYKHPIGHVVVELEHDGKRSLTGMTHTGNDAKRWVLKEGWGLASMLGAQHGRLEAKADLDTELADHFKTGRARFASFEITPQTGARLAQYLAEYRDKGVGKVYGGVQRPRCGEGAGCSAFAASFVELAGLLDPKLAQRWSHTLQMPESLIGGPGTGRHVGVGKMLFSKTSSRWAKADEPHRTLRIFDPELMHDWIGDQLGKQTARAATRQRAKGVIIDATSVATPTDPIWQAP